MHLLGFYIEELGTSRARELQWVMANLPGKPSTFPVLSLSPCVIFETPPLLVWP
jgi:hypothetical protein